MTNNTKKIIFSQIGGIWQSNEQKPRTLTDFLEYYNLQFDDKCIFARYEIHRELRKQNNLLIEICAFEGNIKAYINELK